MSVHRLALSHEFPAGHATVLARATLARTVHGLAERNFIELVRETSTPAGCAWDVRASRDTRDALREIARALLGEGSATWRWDDDVLDPCPHCGSDKVDRGATGLDLCDNCGGLSRDGQPLFGVDRPRR